MIHLSALGQLFSATRVLILALYMLMICALICIHLQNKGRLQILVDVSFFTEILLLKVILVYFTLVISVL